MALRLRERLRVRLPVRLRVPVALRVTIRLRVPVGLRVRVRLLVPLAELAAYVHCSPDVTVRPLAPPSWMKYVRCVAVMLSVDASALLPQATASSFPMRQPNGNAHAGQPVPTYSTVLLAVSPHVDSVSVPPRGVASPSDSEYTSRAPG